MCLAGLGLAFFARRPHNAGDVGLSFLFQEGIVVGGGRNLCRVVAEIDDLLVLLDRGLRPGLLGLFQADDVGGFERGRFYLGLYHFPHLTPLSAFAAARRRWRDLIDGLADGTRDRRPAQVVKPRPTARANALGSPCGFRH
jgi:hypothetical protein